MDNATVLQKLENLKEKGLVEKAFQNIKIWLEGEEYAEFKDEIIGMIEGEKVDELNDAF